MQINRLSDVVNTAIAQDPARLGNNIDDLTVRYLFEPLGMNDSDWNSGLPNKVFAFSWHSTIRDMARAGLSSLHDGVWNGQRIVDSSWIYKMTHASFEDANTAYGLPDVAQQRIELQLRVRHHAHTSAPRRLRTARLARQLSQPDLRRPGLQLRSPVHLRPTVRCRHVYFAGLGGQYVVGHKGLDLLIIAKDNSAGPALLWQAVRALVALDPTYQGEGCLLCGVWDQRVCAGSAVF